ERFKAIAEDYAVLSDPKTRERYDSFGPDFRQVPEDVDPETWRRARAGAGAGAGASARGRPGGGRTVFTTGGLDADFEDLLGGFFGGRGWGPVPGADQETEIGLTIEEAYRGVRRTIAIAGPDGSRTLDVTIPAGVTEGSASGWPARRAAAARAHPAATSTSWSGWRHPPGTGSGAATWR